MLGVQGSTQPDAKISALIVVGAIPQLRLVLVGELGEGRQTEPNFVRIPLLTYLQLARVELCTWETNRRWTDLWAGREGNSW